MTRFLFLFASVLLVLLGSVPVHAITSIPRDFDQLVSGADTVFKGTVTARESRWVGEGQTRHIVTFVTFQVQETYKGEPAAQQTLRIMGGTVGDETMEIPDMPKFEVGQKAVLFVVNNGKQFCPLVGIAQGRFHVITEAATGRERVFSDDGSPLANTAEISKFDAAGIPRLKADAKTGAKAMAAEDFRSEILSKVASIPR